MSEPATNDIRHAIREAKRTNLRLPVPASELSYLEQVLEQLKESVHEAEEGQTMSAEAVREYFRTIARLQARAVMAERLRSRAIRLKDRLNHLHHAMNRKLG